MNECRIFKYIYLFISYNLGLSLWCRRVCIPKSSLSFSHPETKQPCFLFCLSPQKSRFSFFLVVFVVSVSLVLRLVVLRLLVLRNICQIRTRPPPPTDYTQDQLSRLYLTHIWAAMGRCVSCCVFTTCVCWRHVVTWPETRTWYVLDESKLQCVLV